MASVGIIQRRDTKYNLVKSKPLIGEIVFAIDTEEYGTLVSGQLIWKKFEDIVKSVAGKTGHVVLDKIDVGLDKVDNTPDADKLLSNAALAKWVEHLNAINPHHITKEQIGLGNVDNTADTDKPVPSATQLLLDGKLGIHDVAYDSARIGGVSAEDLTLDTYSKDDIDNKLSVKVNIENVYTRIEMDNVLDDKADKDSTYLKSEADLKFESKANKGQPYGYAGLDAAGKIPTDELYSNKEVEEFASRVNFPNIGQSNYLYIDKLNNAIYRFNTINSQYEILSISLGELDSTAYRGDRGKVAYDHTFNFNNPHNVTYEDVGAVPLEHSHESILTVQSLDKSLIIEKITEINIDTDSSLKFTSPSNGEVTLSAKKSFETFTDGVNHSNDIDASTTPVVTFESTNQVKSKVQNNTIGFELNAFTYLSSNPSTSFTITHGLKTYKVLINIYVLNSSGQWEFSIMPYKMVTNNILSINLTTAKNIMVNIIPLGEIS